MELLSVQEAVDFLSAATGAHFSVCMWAPPEVPLRFESQVHASPFCAAAKTTARGLDRCLRCKERANRRAQAGEPFEGLCAWGVYEFAHPICVDERVVGVVYAGNLRGAADGARRRAWACARTGVCADRLETLWAAMPELGARAPQLRCAVRWLAEWIALRGADRPKPAPGRASALHRCVCCGNTPTAATCSRSRFIGWRGCATWTKNTLGGCSGSRSACRFTNF